MQQIFTPSSSGASEENSKFGDPGREPSEAAAPRALGGEHAEAARRRGPGDGEAPRASWGWGLWVAAAPGDPREGAAKAPGEGCRAAEDTAAPRRGGRAPTPGRGALEPRARPPRGRRGNRSPGRSVGTCAPFPAARITQGGTAPLGTPVRPERLALPRGQPRSRLSSRPPFGARTRRTEWGGGGGGGPGLGCTRGCGTPPGARCRDRDPPHLPAGLARSARAGERGGSGYAEPRGAGEGPRGTGRAPGAGCRGRIPRGRARAVRMLVLA